MISWAWEAFRPLLWAALSVGAIGAGLGAFFFFDLVALQDPQSQTVSQLLREFNSWGWESKLLTYGLPILLVVWFIAHLENSTSP